MQADEVGQVYRVRRSWSAPDLASATPAGGRISTQECRSRVRCLDTGSGTLQRIGVTVQHELGADGAWELAVPGQPVRRWTTDAESGDECAPQALLDLLADVLADQPLIEVAGLDSIRTVHSFLDQSGATALVVSDDLAQGSPIEHGQPVQWRELVVQRGPVGTDKLSRRVGRLLVGAGARVTEHQAPLDRIRPIEWARPSRSTGAQLLTAYVQRQCVEILRGAISPVTEEPARTAIERLRGALRAFAASFDPEVAEARSRLEHDLAWLHDLLAASCTLVRVDARLAERLSGLPGELLLGPVEAQLAEHLAAERERVRVTWSEARPAARYQELFASIAQWLVEVPAAGGKKPKPTKLLTTHREELERRPDHPESAARDVLSVIEVLETEFSSGAAAEATKARRRAERVLELTAQHRDLVAETDVLRRVAAATGERSGRNGFTFGVLWAEADAEIQQLQDRLQQP